MDKRFLHRVAVAMGLAALSPAAIHAQTDSNLSVRQVMTDPAYAETLQRIWDYVQGQDDVRIYLAFLEACGDSPVCAAFAAIARDIVVERTANFTNMPQRQYVLTLVGDDNRIGSVYAG